MLDKGQKQSSTLSCDSSYYSTNLYTCMNSCNSAFSSLSFLPTCFGIKGNACVNVNDISFSGFKKAMTHLLVLESTIKTQLMRFDLYKERKSVGFSN